MDYLHLFTVVIFNITFISTLIFLEDIRAIIDPHERNAVRHAYWNALMTKTVGRDSATQFSNAHEKGCPDTRFDDNQADIINNAKGRDIGEANPNATFEEMYELILQAWTKNQLRGYVPTREWLQTGLIDPDVKIRNPALPDPSKRIDITVNKVVLTSDVSHGVCREAVINGLKFVGQDSRLGYAAVFVEEPFVSNYSGDYIPVVFDTTSKFLLAHSAPATSNDGPGVVVGKQWYVNTNFQDFGNNALIQFGMRHTDTDQENQLVLDLKVAPLPNLLTITTLTPPWANHFPYWGDGGISSIDVLDLNTYNYYFRNAVCSGLGMYLQPSGFVDQHKEGQMDRIAFMVQISAYRPVQQINQIVSVPRSPVNMWGLGSLTGPNSALDRTEYFLGKAICGVQLVSDGGAIGLQLQTTTQVPLVPGSETYLETTLLPKTTATPFPVQNVPAIVCAPVWTATTDQVITGVQLRGKDGNVVVKVQLMTLQQPDPQSSLKRACGQVVTFPAPYHRNLQLEVQPIGNSGWHFSTHAYTWNNAVLTGLQFNVEADVLSLLPTISVVGDSVLSANLRTEDGRIEFDPELSNAP